MNPALLRAEVARLRADLSTLHTRSQTDELTEREWKEADEKLARLADLEADLARCDQLVAAERAGWGRNGDGARDFQHQRQTVATADVRDVDRLPDADVRSRALAYLERSNVPAGQGDHLDALLRSEDPECDGSYIARRTLITEAPAYKRAFQKVLTKATPHLTGEEAEAIDALERLERHYTRAMNITTAGSGGYGVPVLIDPTIMITDQGAANFFREISTVKTITTKDWRGVSAAGVTWAFETESAAANDLSPTLTQPIIHAHKCQGAIPFTIEVGMDYPGFAEEMANLLAEGYNELLVDKFTRGSGTGEPWGIFEACEQATSQVTVTTDGTLTAHDVMQIWAALPQRFRRNASWVMNVDVNNELRALGDDKLYQQTVSLRDSAVDVLMGRPVYESPYAPTFTGTTGQASILVVGNFKNFVIAERAGMNVELVQHLVDTSTGLPTGQRAFYAWARVGSDLTIDNAARLLVNT